MRKTSQVGVAWIKQCEGLRLKAYRATPSEKYLTIGYGHYGADVKPNMVITEEEAEKLLIGDLPKYEMYVNDISYVPVIGILNQTQFDILVSFCYNCGQGNLKTLCKGRTIDEIGKALTLYVKADGVTYQGLVNRRNAEYAMWTKKVVNAPNTMLDDNDVDFILKVMGDYWNKMSGNKEIQKHTHYVANKLRKAVGRKEE